MPTTEHDLRVAFHQQPPAPSPDADAALRTGRQGLRRRRLRRTAAALVAPAVLLGVVVVDRGTTPYELAGSGLTLAATAGGPVQVSDDRVDLGDGIQAWREDENLSIGYPGGPHATLDTSSITSGWGELGYDTVVFDDPGQDDGSTIVVGTISGTPTSVSVSIDGVVAPAVIACFDQAQGWCSYKANVPTSIRSYDPGPLVEVR